MGLIDKVNVEVNGSGDLPSTLSTYTTKILKPNIVGGRNILTQAMISSKNTKYVIKWNFDLDGKTITVPANCVLEFDGGSLRNGTIIGQDTVFINVGDVDIWGENLTREGTWREHSGGSSIDIDDALSSTSENPVQNKVVKAAIDNIQGGADKEYNPAEFSGLGRVYLKKNIVEVGGVEKNILIQSAFYKEGTQTPNTDTVFVVQYDFDLNGQTINVPARCVLEFDGGSMSGGNILTNGEVTIKGYGFKCEFDSDTASLSFLNPYHVDYSNGLSENDADGSENKPFKYPYIAAKYSNKIALKRGDIYELDCRQDDDAFIVMSHNLEISDYGEDSSNPTFNGKCEYGGISKTSVTITTTTETISGLRIIAQRLKQSFGAIEYSQHPKLFNVGYISDGYIFRKNVPTENNVVFGTWSNVANVASPIYNSILYGRPSFYDYVCSAGINGILKEGYKLTIKNVTFTDLGKHAIGHLGDNYVTNCCFYNIGGSVQRSTVRYGNGVENYGSTSCHCLVENCVFDTIFDAAVTSQGTTEIDSMYAEINNCRFSSCQYGLEFFANTNNKIIKASNNVFNNCGTPESDKWQRGRHFGAALVTWAENIPGILSGNILINTPIIGTQIGLPSTRLEHNTLIYSYPNPYITTRPTSQDTEEIVLLGGNSKKIENELNSKGMDNHIIVNSNSVGGKIAFLGDSICAGIRNQSDGWAIYTGEKLRMDYDNLGVVGATTTVVPERTSILTILKNIKPDEYDYVIIEPSVVNDPNTTQMGTLSETFLQEGDNPDYDDTLYYGALEQMCRYAQNNFKKVGFIIPYKLGSTPNITANTTRPDAVKLTCEKYGIPCLDLRSDAGFNLVSKAQHDKYGLVPTNYDDVHCNNLAYSILGQKICEFVKSL